MKLFNVFDRWGNKLGEVYEADPDYIGLGGFLGGFGLFIIGAGAVIIWPVFFKLLFHRFTTDYERSCGIVQLASFAVTLAIMIILDCRSKEFSFLGSWSSMLAACTFFPGVISYAYGYVHGEKDFLLLVGYFFICFLMSIGGGFAGTILVLIARFIKFRCKK